VKERKIDKTKEKKSQKEINLWCMRLHRYSYDVCACIGILMMYALASTFLWCKCLRRQCIQMPIKGVCIFICISSLNFFFLSSINKELFFVWPWSRQKLLNHINLLLSYLMQFIALLFQIYFPSISLIRFPTIRSQNSYKRTHVHQYKLIRSNLHAPCKHASSISQ